MSTTSKELDTVAKRIRHARGLKDWNQKQLAVAAGLTPSGVSNIESEIRTGRSSLPQIADALGVRYKWLAFGEGEVLEDAPAVRMSTEADFSRPSTSRHSQELYIPNRAHDRSELSVMAAELAEVFDLIPSDGPANRVRRLRIYLKAMQIIVNEIESPSIAGTDPGK